MLKKLDSMFGNIWLCVDKAGGEKLERWYDAVLPRLGWKKILRPNRWHKSLDICSFWLKARESMSEEFMVNHIG